MTQFGLAVWSWGNYGVLGGTVTTEMSCLHLGDGNAVPMLVFLTVFSGNRSKSM